MPGTQPRRSFAAKVASATNRRAPMAAGPAVRQVQRRDAGRTEADEVWVVVEAAANIAAKGHAYISFDPAGTYP